MTTAVAASTRFWMGAIGWRDLLRLAAIVESGLLLGAGVLLGDREALALGVLSACLAFLTFRSTSRIGPALLALIFLDVLVWMIPAFIANWVGGASGLGLAVPGALSVVSLAGLARAADLLTFGDSAPSMAGAVSVALATVLGLLLLGGVAMARGTYTPPPAELTLEARNAAFSSNTLTADAGQITVALSNDDLFWHTFTIDGLGVDMRVPVKGQQSVTFTAAPGTYVFYCAIPGHESLGMRGTLVVH